MLADEKPKREGTRKRDVTRMEYLGWASAMLFIICAVIFTLAARSVVEGGHAVTTAEARPDAMNATVPTAQQTLEQQHK